ncbi:winged helix-turn-helix transcriptional regulator [Cohnella faecalis]|nr:helix-turn-helix domain-containing protein [Cohnella faecalis]
MYMNEQQQSVCLNRLHRVLDLFGGKWSFEVIAQLYNGSRRYHQLQQALESISSKALSDTLRRLESGGIVKRTVYATTPVTVEYSLTPQGFDFRRVISEMNDWAAKWLPNEEEVSSVRL